jgi:hypothetical protein
MVKMSDVTKEPLSLYEKASRDLNLLRAERLAEQRRQMRHFPEQQEEKKEDDTLEAAPLPGCCADPEN